MNNCIVEVEYEYVVLKINGYDISHLPWYEAVQKFLQAKETIVVELCRQKHNELDCTNAKLSDVDKTVPNALQSTTCESDLSAQTENTANAVPTATANDSQLVDATSIIPAPLDVTAKKSPVILTLRALSHEERLGNATALAASKETQTQPANDTDVLRDHDFVQTITNHFIEQEHHLFEQCLEPEIDIEEVTLIKAVENSTNTQIGLIICSSGFQSTCIDTNKGDILCNDSEHCEDVFISGIQPESIAHRDGRLRQGDQILRINGVDVKNQEEVENQIAESSTAVTLLVSRILYPEDEDDEDIHFEYANSFIPDDYTNVVDKLDKVLLSHVQSFEELSNETGEHSSDLKVQTSSLPDKFVDQSSKLCGKTKIRPDAIQTDNQKTLKQSLSKNQVHLQHEYDESEHIYETIPEDSESEPLYCSPYQSSNGKSSMGCCSSAISTTPAEVLETTMQQQTQRVAQWLGLKPQYPRTIHTLVGRPAPLKLTQQPNCSRVFTLRSTLTNTSRSSSSGVAYSGYGPNNILGANLAFGEEVDNSSSAYNTGGSNNSASPHQNTTNADDDITANHNLESRVIDGRREALDTTAVSSMLLLPFGKSGRIGLCSSNMSTSYVNGCKPVS
ncbi:slo-interacting protein 1 isoform X2 [Drosophila biarmipes]|uniref:slo-interacting protein 1 isoform X2 n=1 Tax=Drosophila biarmipes TaxID=125945 RepID=UPI001CDAEF6C|nr:slo-interacting protein 1 isoform X2 [Drosophila biarmipes]